MQTPDAHPQVFGILAVFAPLTKALRRQTFREAGIRNIEIRDTIRPLREAELDADFMEVTVPMCASAPYCPHCGDIAEC